MSKKEPKGWLPLGSVDPFAARNEVYFFIADPVILPKFLIPGSKRDENFDALSRKILLIQNA